MKLSPSDWKRIDRCLPRLYSTPDARKHASCMLQVISEFVSGDMLSLNKFNVETRDYRAVTLPDDGVITPEVLRRAAGLLHQSPFPAYVVATGDTSWKMITDFMPIEDFHATDLYRACWREWRAGQQMCAMLAQVENQVDALVINRLSQGFTEYERAFLNALHPHLVASHLNARAFSQVSHSISGLKAAMETSPGAYAYFTADHSVAWAQPKAQAWLLEFFSDEVKTHGSVPLTIWGLLQRSETNGGTPQYLKHLGPTDNLIATLSPSPLGGWILRLERTPKTPLPRFRPLAQFSARKNHVLRWMVEGKRNSEIAVILGLSPRTVEKHVQDILAALGVENRATAIIRAMELSVGRTEESPKK